MFGLMSRWMTAFRERPQVLFSFGLPLNALEHVHYRGEFSLQEDKDSTKSRTMYWRHPGSHGSYGYYVSYCQSSQEEMNSSLEDNSPVVITSNNSYRIIRDNSLESTFLFAPEEWIPLSKARGHFFIEMNDGKIFKVADPGCWDNDIAGRIRPDQKIAVVLSCAQRLLSGETPEHYPEINRKYVSRFKYGLTLKWFRRLSFFNKEIRTCVAKMDIGRAVEHSYREAFDTIGSAPLKLKG